MIKGQSYEVCNAYLQRLNATEYLNNDPTQGRVSEPPQEGFADLKPTPLTDEEIQRLYLKILSFNRYQDQDLIVRFKQEKPGYFLSEPPDEKLPELIKGYIEQDQKTPFIRFQVLMDLNNDGIANDTVIQNNNSAYFVDPGLNWIDELRMKSLFGDQEIMDWPTVQQFPPLVHPLHVFYYQGKYYFDGFINIYFGKKPRFFPSVISDAPLILSVFLYRDYQRYEICQYKWINGSINGLSDTIIINSKETKFMCPRGCPKNIFSMSIKVLLLIFIGLSYPDDSYAFNTNPVISLSVYYCEKAYLIQLFDSGLVEYRGLRGVKTLGQRNTVINASIVSGLLKQAEDNGFFLADNRLKEDVNSRKFSRLAIRIQHGEKSATVFNSNEALSLENEILKIREIAKWIGKAKSEEGCTHHEIVLNKDLKLISK